MTDATSRKRQLDDLLWRSSSRRRCNRQPAHAVDDDDDDDDDDAVGYASSTYVSSPSSPTTAADNSGEKSSPQSSQCCSICCFLLTTERPAAAFSTFVAFCFSACSVGNAWQRPKCSSVEVDVETYAGVGVVVGNDVFMSVCCISGVGCRQMLP